MDSLRQHFEHKLEAYPAKKELLTKLMAWANDKESFFGAIESNIVERSTEEGVEPIVFVDELFALDVESWLSRFS
jgi:hypothetical protein